MIKRVLVTGGAGYVGSHACLTLAKAGYEPVTFDNLSRGHREAVRWGDLTEGDLEDPTAIDRAIEQHRPDAVMHFAALAYVGESVAEPLRYYRNIVSGTANLLTAMDRHGVRRLVFSSTCAVYGRPTTGRIAEDHPMSPINPYGRSKLAAERMLADVAAAGRLDAVALRYFNAAGAAPAAGLREDHEPETHLIPLALRAALGTGEALTVHGDDYPTPDGTCIRDYVHVLDLAEAHVAALAWFERANGYRAINLGTGRGHSVREVIDAVARVSGRAVPHTIGLRRPGDPPELVADATLAAGVLGWTARRPAIDAIVADALAAETELAPRASGPSG